MLMRKRSSMAASSSRSNTNPSHLTSPRFLSGFSAKASSEIDSTASPTSILESKPLSSGMANPFKPRPSWHHTDSMEVGLGIVDSLLSGRPELQRKYSNNESRMVLFGSQLKIQIPTVHTNSSSPVPLSDSPGSPIEFGLKNKSSQLGLLSPALRSPMSCSSVVLPLLASDMELSEDYTCVIAHGPNPKTTHIFDNCILESCCGGLNYVPSPREKTSLARHSDDFLSFCHACKKSLGPGKDIFMYRGEIAFCSSECRCKEMMFDEEMENTSSGSSVAL